jgi:D-proline reductase (dithiol) PrdB
MLIRRNIIPLHYLPILARRAAPNPPRELQHITKPAWCPLTLPLHKMRVALITSGAIREGSRRPFPRLGDASYRRINSDPAVTDLHVDHRSPFGIAARKDPETVFPRQALRALADQGLIGSVAPFHLSIYGGIRLYREIEENLAPALTRELVRGGVDLAVFLPF